MFEARYLPERHTSLHYFDTWYFYARSHIWWTYTACRIQTAFILTWARAVRTHILPQCQLLPDNYFVWIRIYSKFCQTKFIPFTFFTFRFQENSKSSLNCCVTVTRGYMTYYCLICIRLPQISNIQQLYMELFMDCRHVRYRGNIYPVHNCNSQTSPLSSPSVSVLLWPGNLRLGYFVGASL